MRIAVFLFVLSFIFCTILLEISTTLIHMFLNVFFNETFHASDHNYTSQADGLLNKISSVDSS